MPWLGPQYGDDDRSMATCTEPFLVCMCVCVRGGGGGGDAIISRQSPSPPPPLLQQTNNQSQESQVGGGGWEGIDVDATMFQQCCILYLYIGR